MSDHAHDSSSGTASHKPLPDDTPPRNGVILLATFVAVTTLFSLKYVFYSYLDRSEMRVRRGHVATSLTSEHLAEYREHANAQLLGGEMPIEDAMDQLATRGRGAFAQIRPIADTSTGAREGWARMPVRADDPAPHAERVREPLDAVIRDLEAEDPTLVPPSDPAGGM